MRTFWLAFALASAVATSAGAQSGILVVPTLSTEGEGDGANALAGVLESELRARGSRFVDPSRAVERFEQVHSASPALPEQDTVQDLARCMDEVLGLTAAGQAVRARSLGRACLGLAETALETLNRRTEAAQQVLDGCLYQIRALLDGHRVQRASASDGAREAIAEARRCRTLVPDLAPTVRMHPPEVLDVVAQVDEELRHARSTFRVTSNEPGCAVYLNGRRLGATPFVRVGLPGSVYRVQVECGGVTGRVRRVQLGSDPVTLHVDERFDAAVHSESGRLQLIYGDSFDAAAHRLQDGRTIAAAVRASEVWLLTHEGETHWRVDRVRIADGRVLASVRLSSTDPAQGIEHDAAGRAVALLLEGESRDLSGPREERLDPWAPAIAAAVEEEASAEAPTTTEPHFANWLIGGGLVAGGLVALVSPIHTLARQGECTDMGGLSDGWCRSGVSFGTQSGVLLGVGLGAIVGGAVFMLLSPFQTQVQAAQSSTSGAGAFAAWPFRIDFAADATSARITLVRDF